MDDSDQEVILKAGLRAPAEFSGPQSSIHPSQLTELNLKTVADFQMQISYFWSQEDFCSLSSMYVTNHCVKIIATLFILL